MSPSQSLRMTSKTEKPTLLTLPAELRNRIYHLVLTKGSPISPYRCEDKTEEPASLRLLRTCRQIRSEATSIYYGTNMFRFYDSILLELHLRLFLGDIGPQNLQLCKSISLVGRCNPNGQTRSCPENYCRASVEVDFKDKTVRATSKADCCGRPYNITPLVNAIRRRIERVVCERAIGSLADSLAVSCSVHFD